ncbi:hypothetical protein I6N90_21390 [Paenibacillus sp. GSMTC-2017]|uniref:hypothetical protein n=1 Tax=Paenibacillus sp. GSMTC-2017 TaxID=2794350 RepID=UPI0018DA061E|nr:hypothetical protein [Paenibacillus sp. GSMTC-2017]MBH5320350.1 hypothetical protein [Paenibacillus sp. GSMTC-2017]
MGTNIFDADQNDFHTEENNKVTNNQGNNADATPHPHQRELNTSKNLVQSEEVEEVSAHKHDVEDTQ